jgi:hypothetical protein
MPELSISSDGKARETLAVIFQALSAKGQGAIAKAMDISDSSMSRWKSDEIPVMAKLLCALELKIVPETFTCVDPEYLRSLRVLARKGLEAQ